MRKLLIFCLAFLAAFANSAPQDYGVTYDIVYVRYPGTDPDGDTFIKIPQGESAYAIAQGADLMLLKPDGTEEVIVDCTTCSRVNLETSKVRLIIATSPTTGV